MKTLKRLKKLKKKINNLILPEFNKKDQGLNMVETLIVIAIIGMFAGSATVIGMKYMSRGNNASAKDEIRVLSIALDDYLWDCKQYPTQEQGLKALIERPMMDPVPAEWNGPYLNKLEMPLDPWQREYDYLSPGPSNLPYGIRSLGADGMEGGEGNDADICSWED